ncbi:MAG: His/Gly/Thr/Pro-type tRNA ligase C-terminal domain-containing protein, partial [Thermoplasmata archaeon]
GFGMGFDRVFLALEKAGVELADAELDVYVVPVGDHMRDAGYDVLRRVRDAGLSADVDLTGRGPSKNLDHADALGARMAVLVGEREWEIGKVGVKDLLTGEQTDVPLDELISALGAA